jgi:TolB protein
MRTPSRSWSPLRRPTLLISSLVAVGAALITLGGGPGGPTHASAFPGRNGAIAFSSDVDGDREIFLINQDGSGSKKLTNNTAGDDSPVWSPDGSRIAFTSNRDGQDEIYVMNADGSNQVNITKNPAKDQAPTWSPDGRRIAFHSDRVGGSFEIWVTRSDGSSPVQLTSNPPFVNANPAWSPDGSKILFHSGRDINSELYWMNPDGSDQTRLTFNDATDVESSWSPDGSRIAFQSDRGGNYDVYVMDAYPGAAANQITFDPGPDTAPTWSPQGDLLAVQGNHGGTNDLFFVTPSGEARGGFSTAGQDRFPDWQPLGGLPPLKPEVVVAGGTASVSPNSVTVTGAANPNGRDTTVWFEYGTSLAYGLRTPGRPIGAGNADVPFADALTGLSQGTAYHYRVVAANAIGTTFGPDQVVGTALSPVVVTLPPDAVGQRNIRMRGRVDTNDVTGLSYHFEYGRTAQYGDSTPSRRVSGPGSTTVTEDVGGLRPRTGYHYRLVVTGAATQLLGDDQVATTSGPATVDSSFTPTVRSIGSRCTLSRATLLIKLRDPVTGRLLGPTARRGLIVSVRSSAGAAGIFVPRRRVRTTDVGNSLVTLRFSEGRDRTFGNIAALAKRVKFRPGSYLAVRISAPGIRGAYHEIRFTRTKRVRKECVLRPGSSRPTSCEIV